MIKKPEDYINQINYITSDPFSSSIYKYPLENIPFKDGYFDSTLFTIIAEFTKKENTNG